MPAKKATATKKAAPAKKVAADTDDEIWDWDDHEADHKVRVAAAAAAAAEWIEKDKRIAKETAEMKVSKNLADLIGRVREEISVFPWRSFNTTREGDERRSLRVLRMTGQPLSARQEGVVYGMHLLESLRRGEALSEYDKGIQSEPDLLYEYPESFDMTLGDVLVYHIDSVSGKYRHGIIN